MKCILIVLIMLITGCDEPKQEVSNKQSVIDTHSTESLPSNDWASGVGVIDWISDGENSLVIVDEFGDRVYRDVNSSKYVPILLDNANVYIEETDNMHTTVVEAADGEKRRIFNYFNSDGINIFSEHNSNYNNHDYSDYWSIRVSVYHARDGVYTKEIHLDFYVNGTEELSCDYFGWGDNPEGYCYFDNEQYPIVADVSYIFDIDENSINHDWAMRIKNTLTLD